MAFTAAAARASFSSVVVARTSKGTTKKATTTSRPSTTRSAPKTASRPLWLPNVTPPPYLDGSLVGDRGYDPLGFGAPREYLQFGLDESDINKAVNKPGEIIGKATLNKDLVSATAFQPYNDVFSLTRFRENEVINGRWAMLFVAGAVAAEAFTGVSWQDAGKVELVEGASYAGLPLPFSVPVLTAIEVVLIGYIEFARNAELDTEKRLYPGGYFDPLGLATPDKINTLKLAEIKHARLAMVASAGLIVQAFVTGEGPLANIAALRS